MAAIFKPTFTRLDAETGRRVRLKGTKWHIRYRDADGILRRVPGYRDKEATRQFAAELEKKAALDALPALPEPPAAEGIARATGTEGKPAEFLAPQLALAGDFSRRELSSRGKGSSGEAPGAQALKGAPEGDLAQSVAPCRGEIVGGGTRIRTGDDGFANRCLSHLAMPPCTCRFLRFAAKSLGFYSWPEFLQSLRLDILLRLRFPCVP